MSAGAGRDQGDAVAPDGHLCAALRHAPDADAQPPAALSEAILHQARASVAAPAKAPLPRPRRRRWFDVFALAGPMRATAGGLLVATLVGVLWWGEPLPPVREQPPQVASADEAAAAGAAAASAESAVAAASVAATPRAPADDLLQRTDRRRAEAAPANAAPAERRASPRQTPALQDAPAASAAAARDAAAKPRPGPADSATPASPPAAALGAATAPQPAAAEAASAAPATAEPSALAKAGAPSGRADTSALRAQQSRARAAPPVGAASEADVDSPPGAPLPPSELDAGARAWLARLNAEAGASWQRAAGVLPAGRLHRWPADGAVPPRLTIVLTPAGAFWRDHAGAGATWFAPLTPAQLDRLGAP